MVKGLRRECLNIRPEYNNMKAAVKSHSVFLIYLYYTRATMRLNYYCTGFLLDFLLACVLLYPPSYVSYRHIIDSRRVPE